MAFMVSLPSGRGLDTGVIMVGTKAVDQLNVSIPNQAESKHPSKREEAPHSRGYDNVYARLRRLEQRIERIEANNSTVRRDVFRIEKRQQREVKLPSNEIETPAGAQELILTA